MLFWGNPTLALAANFRPCCLCENRPREPAKIYREVVKPPEILANAIPVCVHDREQVFARRFHQRLVADRVKGFAAQRTGAPFLSRGDAMGRHFVHGGLPCALDHSRVMGGKVGPAHGQRNSRLPVRLVHGVKQIGRFAFVPGLEAALFGGAVFLPVETAIVAAIESVFYLHVHLR